MDNANVAKNAFRHVTGHAAPVLIFRGQRYQLDILMMQSSRAPMIEVAPGELNLPGSGNGTCEPRFSGSVADDRDEKIAFYRQEGKYTILLGHARVSHEIARGAKSLRGRLISSPALKRARIDAPLETAQATAPVTAPVAPTRVHEPVPVKVNVSSVSPRITIHASPRKGAPKPHQSHAARTGGGFCTYSGMPCPHKPHHAR